MISDDVFLTASHSTEPLDGLLVVIPTAEVLVTFDPSISTCGTFFTGQWIPNPNYDRFAGKGGHLTVGTWH